MPAPGPQHPFGTWPGGGALDLVFSPLAQWDSGQYLTIVNYGYGVVGGHGQGPQTAFFPLYPMLVKGVGLAFGGSQGANLIAAYAVSLAAFLGALYFLSRLVALELGSGPRKVTVILLAAFPGSLYFSAPYSESLFLLTSLAAFYAARRGLWMWAGVAAGLASGTRAIGVVLIVPLVLLYLYGPREDAEPRSARRLMPRYRLRTDALWLALAPSGLAAYCLYLKWKFDDAFAWETQERISFSRVRSDPLATAWDGAKQAYHAVEKLPEGLTGSIPVGGAFDWEHAQAAIAIFEFLILCLAVIALIGAFRRLPFAYGTYVLSLLVILSTKVSTAPPTDIGRPLQSMHRFVAVLFPLFMWLGLVAHERDRREGLSVAFAIPLGLLTAMFATRYWLV